MRNTWKHMYHDIWKFAFAALQSFVLLANSQCRLFNRSKPELSAVPSLSCSTNLHFTRLQGEVAFLLATDVAARGLDILGLEVVINYDAPTNLASYLHRIGRTARAGMLTQPPPAPIQAISRPMTLRSLLYPAT